jgi:hypothetical protein
VAGTRPADEWIQAVPVTTAAGPWLSVTYAPIRFADFPVTADNS